ncbi:unnamed protein product [Closterium sp. Naga37s-1]|nr:unnamed protein product [Closterium sp. Naga37s-1]
MSCYMSSTLIASSLLALPSIPYIRVANLEAELATCRHTIASLEMEIADVRHDLQDAEQKKAGAAAMWKEEHSKRTAAEEEVRFYQRQAATALEQRDQVTLELEQLRTAKAEGEARCKGEIEQLRKEKASAAEKSRAEIEKLMKEKWDLLERVKEAGRHAAALVKQQELGDEKIEEAERGRREADRGREEAEREREEERRERERVEREREEERRERERVEREREEERRERERVEREGKEEEGRLREEISRLREEGARLKEEAGRLTEEVERRRNGAREWEAVGRESEGQDPYGTARDPYGTARDPYGEEPTEEMLSQAMREKVEALVMLAAEEERHLRDSQLVGSLRETIAGLNATLGQVVPESIRVTGAMREKVQALVMLAAEEERHLRDSQLVGSLRETIAGLNATLGQVPGAEKVLALMQLADTAAE